jgi:hypothetical protein
MGGRAIKTRSRKLSQVSLPVKKNQLQQAKIVSDLEKAL